MKVPTFTKAGAKATKEVTLDKSVFGRDVSVELLKQAYLRVLNNNRQATAKTKTRGEIRGGGKKPWRQKGTGRARTGSIRNPLWRGGGTIFGPTGLQNYSVSMPVKAVRASVAHALSSQADRISIIDSFIVESGKTKDALALLAKLQIADKRVLIAVGKTDAMTQRAIKNISNVQYQSQTALTAYDILNADHIILDHAGLEAVQTRLGAKS